LSTAAALQRGLAVRAVDAPGLARYRAARSRARRTAYAGALNIADVWQAPGAQAPGPFRIRGAGPV